MRLLAAMIVTGALLFVSANTQKDDRAEVALRGAIDKETVDGDLKAAIDEYARLAQSSNRGLAARALLRMGQCHEKLGNSEARKTYERLVRDFADQGEIVKEAQTRLAALTGPETKPKFTKIRIPTKLPRDGTEFALSPDGEQLAYVSDGSVWLLPIHGPTDPDIAGAPRRISEPVRTWAACHAITWSQDGNWLALNVVERSNGGNYMRSFCLVRSASGEIRRVPLDPKLRAYGLIDVLLSLSRQGDWLAYATWEKSPAERSVYMVPTSGGIPKRLTRQVTAEPAFSPDGEKVAYVGLVADKTSSPEKPYGREIWVTPVSGGTPVLLHSHTGPGRLHGPTWSPDGRMIVSLRNHDNGGELCDEMIVLPVSDQGRPAASASVIRLPQKTYRGPAGWSPDNRIGLVFTSPEVTAVYSVPASGGKAVQLTAKWATMPSWAPDGKRIYFMGAHQTRQEETANIELVPAGGGTVTRIPVRGPHPIQPGYPGGGLSISPDGKRILFQGRFYAARVERLPHMFVIPIEGGEVHELDVGMKLFSYPCWSADGKSFAFVGYQEIAADKRLTDLYTISASGGQAQKLTSDSDRVAAGPVAWSHDGSTIAFYSEDGKIKLVPAAGGPTRVIAEGITGRKDHSGLAWSPNGKELAYGSKGRIWRVSLADGKSQEVQTGLDASHMQIAWSPDGATIAFSAWQGGEPELWLMSDFLPLLQPRGQR